MNKAELAESLNAEIEQASQRLPEKVQAMQGIVDLWLDPPDNNFAPQLSVEGLKYGEGLRTTMFSILDGFNSAVEKRLAMERVAAQLHSDRTVPTTAVLAAEAWVSRQKQGARYVMPEHDPNRREVIVVMGLAFNQAHCKAELPITRDAKGNLLPAGPWKTVPVSSQGESPLLRQIYTAYLELASQSIAKRGGNHATR